MAKFWQTVLKVLIIVVIFAGLMLLITFLVPGVKEYAQGLSQNSKLPLWVVGLFAPIAFVFTRLKDWLTNLLGGGKTEQAIREENEAIKTEMTRLRQEVRALDEWRRESIHREITEVNSLRQTLASMEGRSHGLHQRIQTLSETPASELIKDMTDEEIAREIERRNREMGIEEGELPRLH